MVVYESNQNAQPLTGRYMSLAFPYRENFLAKEER